MQFCSICVALLCVCCCLCLCSCICICLGDSVSCSPSLPPSFCYCPPHTRQQTKMKANPPTSREWRESTHPPINTFVPLIKSTPLFIFSVFFVMGTSSSPNHPPSSSSALRASGAWGGRMRMLGEGAQAVLDVQPTASLAALRMRGGQPTSAVLRPVGSGSRLSKEIMHDRESLR